MGIRIKIVNPVKRQFLDADRFPEHDGRTVFMTGVHATAVAVLVCDPTEVHGHGYGPLAGSWCGDPILAVTDCMRPDSHGLKTSTPERPHRNLYDMALEEFEDISLRAFASVCEGQIGLADALAEQASGPFGIGLLVKLGNVVVTVGCESLADALVEVFGHGWTKLYHELHRLDEVGDDLTRRLDGLRESYGERWPWRES